LTADRAWCIIICAMNNNHSGTGRAGAARRQEMILQLVRGGGIRSQSELARLLRRRGITVAQPTLSRDVRELRLAKTPDGYSAHDGPASARSDARGEGPGKLGRTLRSFVLSVGAAGSLVVIKTPPAAAQPVARALDESPPRDVVGTIAGDDTVFVATPSERAARALGRRLAALAAIPEKRRPA
jgi:transcriptional regulator of arginine metabolism